MTRRDLAQLGAEVKFAALWLGGCFLIGVALTFPFAFRAAQRRYPRETA